MNIRLISAAVAGSLLWVAGGTPALAQIPVPSQAQAAGEAAGKWGLLGEWKLDCKAATAANNPAIEFVVRNGVLFQEQTRGGNDRDYITILAASVRADGGLETTEVSNTNPPVTRQIVRRKQGDSRFSVWSNRVAGTEQYPIRDGKFTNGGMAPALVRCRAPGAKP